MGSCPPKASRHSLVHLVSRPEIGHPYPPRVVRLSVVLFQMIKQSADFGLSFTKTHYYYDLGMTNKRAQVN